MLVRADKKWDYALGLVKGAGLEPTEDMKMLVEKEKSGEISMEEIRKALDQKYNKEKTGIRQKRCRDVL